MSHFSVLVKVQKSKADIILKKARDSYKKAKEEIEKVIDHILAPYSTKTNNEFIDRTQYLEQIKNTIITKDDVLGTTFSKAVGKTLLEHFGSIRAIATKHFGYREEVRGKFGYRQNPNAKWDSYEIGGKWANHLMGRKEGRPTDVIFVKNIDFLRMTEEVYEKIEEFWDNYQHYLEIKDLKNLDKDDLDFIRDAQDYLSIIGVRRCLKKGTPVIKNNQPVMEETLRGLVQKYTNPEFEESELTKDELRSKHRWFFEWGTFAVVDDNGWYEKEIEEEWTGKYFDRFLKDEDPDAMVAMVDCHI